MMASSSTVSNLDANSNRSREYSRKKRRKIGEQGQTEPLTTNLDGTRWRSHSEQQIYSSKLFQALRQVRRSNETPSPAVAGRTVRETADRVLAVRAKGRSRWSRAILTGRLSLRLSQINKKHKKAKMNSGSKVKSKKPAEKKKRLPALQRKVRALGHLVPGCRKLSFPNLLEETTDYVTALEMQVRAMTFLTELLAGAGAGSLAAHADQP